jgi:hypothetical protein
MKSNLLRIFFEWALIASLLMSIGFFAWYWIASHGVRVRESQIAAINEQFQRTQNIMHALGEDCAEYSKTNADLARFLASLASMSAPPPSAAAPVKPKNSGNR